MIYVAISVTFTLMDAGDTMPGLAVAVAQMYLSDSKLCYLTNKIKANVGCVCASVCRCVCMFGVCRFI